MRIAVISDIHGNVIALDAVLADARSLGVDAYWFLGDYVALGPEPGRVLERLAGIEGARYARGNTDRYVVTGEGPPPSLEAVQADPARVPLYAAIAASFAWTRGYVTALGWLDWLAGLSLDFRFTAPDGVRVLAVHAAPGTDDGEGIHPGQSNAELGRLVSGTDADLVIVGHTHQPMVRRVGGTLVVNTGCVSNPRPPDLRASYVVLEAERSGTRVVHRQVAYDRAAFAERLRRSGHPSAEYILGFQRGEYHGRPPHADQAPLQPGEPVRVAAPAGH